MPNNLGHIVMVIQKIVLSVSYFILAPSALCIRAATFPKPLWHQLEENCRRHCVHQTTQPEKL